MSYLANPRGVNVRDLRVKWRVVVVRVGESNESIIMADVEVSRRFEFYARCGTMKALVNGGGGTIPVIN